MFSWGSKVGARSVRLTSITSRRSYSMGRTIGGLKQTLSKQYTKEIYGRNKNQLYNVSRWLFSDTKDEINEADFVESKTENTVEPVATDKVEEEVEDKTVKPTYLELVDTDVEKHAFQTETKQLLDIVAHSLYTDKEVFLRELLSNASDALEKTRYYLNTQTSNIINPDTSLEIDVFTDKDNNRLVIQVKFCDFVRNFWKFLFFCFFL